MDAVKQMPADVSRLNEQLRRALQGDAWHGPSVLELLAGLSAAQAASHPIAGAHSIWELVLHIRTDYDLLLRRLAGDGRPLTEAAGWPACPAPTEQNWRETVRELERSNAKRGLQTAGATRCWPARRPGAGWPMASHVRPGPRPGHVWVTGRR